MRRPKGTSNVLRVWDSATDGQKWRGMSWYAKANSEILRRLFGLPAETACGMIAVLSPQTAWARNIRMAERLWLHNTCYAPRSRRNKALRILGGEDPRQVLNATSKHLGKERSFYECLLDPTTSDWVCIDGHAYSIWRGKRIKTNEVTRFPYEPVANAYRKAASILHLLPHQVQATTWLAWRARHYVRRERDADDLQLYLPFMYEGIVNLRQTA